MTRWSIGTNSLQHTASYYLEEAPWWVFALEAMSQQLCSWCPRIPFPPGGRITLRHDDGTKEILTLKEAYGTLGQWWHLMVDDPVFQWCWRHMKSYVVDIPHELVKTRHPDVIQREKEFYHE